MKYLICYAFLGLINLSKSSIPLVINTWKFTSATENAWNVLTKSEATAIDTLVVGCGTCEKLQCDHTVGYGGSPDENGETTLDALIFDGATMDMGAVGGLRRIKNVISVARHVLEYTKHSLLVGDLATEFAKHFNFMEETLATNYTQSLWNEWKIKKCQPNFWKNVNPDPTTSCGPYEGILGNEICSLNNIFDTNNHDTIGMIVIDKNGNVVAGTSTNGANHKIPGRVGDSPIVGAGAYADNDAGAAVATGDGDIMMRFLPSFLAVEEIRRGTNPKKAAEIAIGRIADKYPDFFGALIACDRKGNCDAACNGMDYFPYSIKNQSSDNVNVIKVTCIGK